MLWLATWGVVVVCSGLTIISSIQPTEVGDPKAVTPRPLSDTSVVPAVTVQAVARIAAPSPRAPVTSAPAPSPTAQAALPTTAAVDRARVTVLSEHFASNQRNWPSDDRATAWLTDGIYRLSVKQPGQFVGIGAPIPEPLRDVVVTGVFRKIGGPAGGGYGIVIRDQGPVGGAPLSQSSQFYVFQAGDQGEYGIWRRAGDRWVDLLPWTASDIVQPGHNWNTLSVTAMGAQLTFEINGTTVARLEDTTLVQGTVGLFAGGDLNDVVVEQITVEALR